MLRLIVTVKGKAVNIMRDGKKLLKFLCFVMACSLIGPAGCRKTSDRLKGEPLSEVLLRYTPRLGQTNNYGFFINIDKKFFIKGRWRKEKNERIEGVVSIKTTEQNGDSYRTKVDIRMGSSNLTKEAMDMMRDKVKAVRSYGLSISDRYICEKPGANNLCFPDEPISPGNEWEGGEPFSFGDMATVNKPKLKMSYRLIKAVENKDGRYCLIECKPLTTQIEVPLQAGQLGLRCDETGRVTAVRQDSDAQGKIKAGDVLVAINGQKAVTKKDWNVVYERFIEMLDNVGSSVLVTIRKDSREQDIEIKKSFVTLGTMEIKISKDTRKVIFDIDRGIIIFDEASLVYSVMYNFFDEFPFVDDYMGASSFEGRAGTKIGPRIYNNQWKMELLQ